MNAFVADTFERTVRASAAAALGAMGTSQLVTALDWQQVGSITAMAGIITILTCISAGKWGSDKASPAGFSATGTSAPTGE